MIAEGNIAPDFTLQNQEGNEVRLYDLLGKGPVVLYFYPKDETPGCTTEACSFRDHYAEFKDAGAEVVGVSGDSAEKHAGFAKNHRLPFILLSDPKREVHQLYQVPKTLFLLPGRVTYVIGKDRKILMAFNSMWKPQQHVREALEIVADLKPGS